jgi:hypothetical protein
MNPNNSDTAEMLKKLLVACLAGLEAGYVTSANLTVDGAVPRSCRKKINGSTRRSHEKFPEDPRWPPYGAKNRSLGPRSTPPTA